VPRARFIVAGVATVVVGVLLWATRGYTFYFDEWTFITAAPGWTLATYFAPHNEHPAIALRAVYSALLHTIGLRAYWPYMAVLLLAHVSNVLLLFELVRRRSGELIALAAALLLLLLGAGWEDLIWAFQMAWLASIACGLGALLALQSPRGAPLAAGLVAAALACSGVGLLFAVAVTVQFLLTRERRRELGWLVPVGVGLAVWWLAFGRLGNHPNPQPTAANLLVDPVYALWALGEAVAAIFGEGGWFGPPLLVLAAAAVAWRWRRSGADPLAVGVLAGLVAFMAAVLAGLPDSTAATASVGASMAFATEITSGAFATEITSGGLVAGSESITDMATIRTMATTTPANILLPRCGTTAPTLRAITPTYRNATPAGSPSPVASRCPVAPASRVANLHLQPAGLRRTAGVP